MRYNEQIDKVILTELTASPTLSFNELYHKICGSYKKISRDAFNFHVKKLKDNGSINARDSGRRGTKVYYFLTESTKQDYQANLAEDQKGDESQELDEVNRYLVERFNKLFQLFFFIESGHSIEHKLCSEQELDDFLSKINLSKKDLMVDSVSSDGDRESQNTVYFNRTITTFKDISGIKIWKEDHYYRHLPKWLSRGSAAQLYEAFGDHNRNQEQGKPGYVYYYTLPGVAPSDLLDNGRHLFEHINFTDAEVRKAFILLEKWGMINSITNNLLGEKRYSIIAEESLRILIREYWSILQNIKWKMGTIWKYVRKPTSEERKWLEVFYGEIYANESFQSDNYERHLLKTNKKEHVATINYMKQKISEANLKISQSIKNLEKNYSDMFKKYPFPLNELREMIYPKHIQDATY